MASFICFRKIKQQINKSWQRCDADQHENKSQRFYQAQEPKGIWFTYWRSWKTKKWEREKNKTLRSIIDVIHAAFESVVNCVQVADTPFPHPSPAPLPHTNHQFVMVN